ncbi:MAG: orotate phosphoribosyltransferase [Vampirovibrio sp.]|nr:orotate phosphoribosyltransferase [Vampirovibrio sp.]
MACSTTHFKERLFQEIQTRSFRKGKFTLASGKTSDYYIDCRTTTLSGEGAYLIGHLLTPIIQELQADAVGGMSIGADPIVSSVLYHSAAMGKPLEGFLVRKEVKKHGAQRQVEGNLQPWMRAVLVEDVITTGGSTLQAIEAIHKSMPSVQIVKVLALVDRSNGDNLITQNGIPFQALYPVSQFLQG